MRIAVLGHIRHPINEPFKGGMEAHAHGLVRALVARGHDITLFASGDSDARLPVQPIIDRHYEATLPWAHWRGTPALRALVAQAYERAWQQIAAGGFDIVHNNSLFAPLLQWATDARLPMLTSLHVPPFVEYREAVSVSAWEGQHFTVTSAQQAELWAGTERLHVAHNGIDLARWRPGATARTGGMLWCGRVTDTKGTADALAAAHRAGVALSIVGPIDCMDYYDIAVAPLLDDKRRYLGHLSGGALLTVMQNATCFIATPKWEEPFGLTTVEAMACGVPVIAYDRGALREVVGDTGVMVPAGCVASLAAAMGTAASLQGAAGLARAQALFSIDAMIHRYEQCYAMTLSDTAAARSAACSSSNASTEAVLA